MTDDLTRVTLQNLDGGGALELANAEFSRVLADALDINSEAKKKRYVTLKIMVEPVEDRSSAVISYDVQSKLAGPKPGVRVVFIGKERDGSAVAYDRIQYDVLPTSPDVPQNSTQAQA